MITGTQNESMRGGNLMNNIVACIVTFNRKDKLINALNALFNQNTKCFDILVVDNASTDNTYESISKYINGGKIQYVNTGNNLGGAGGFAFALKRVCQKYKYAWIMDDDTYPQENALSALIDAGEFLDGQFGFLSSLAEWTDGKSCLMNQQKISKNFYADFRCIKNSLIHIDMASFVSLFVPTSMVIKHGLPIKEFFLWGDDAEFTRRLAGEGGYLVLDSVVTHDMNANDGVDVVLNDKSRISRYYLFVRNRIYMAKQVHSVKGVIKAYLSGMKQILRVAFFAKDNKLYRIKIIIKGLITGIGFNPQIEKIDCLEERKC